MKPLQTTATNSQPPQTLAQPALCVHTLEDLRLFLTAFTAGGCSSLRPVSALRILRVFSPGGLDTTGTKAEERGRWLRYVKKWCHHDTAQKRVLPLPSATEALQIRSASHARSMHRVLHQLHVQQKFSSLFIGILIHSSAPGMRRSPLSQLPWCRDLRNQARSIQHLQRLGLLHISLDWYPHANRHLETLSLTPAGQKLLLGHWGKALQHQGNLPSSPNLPLAA